MATAMTMSEAEDRIAEVIGNHEAWQRPDRSWECACSQTFGIKLHHTEHVAAAVRGSTQ